MISGFDLFGGNTNVLTIGLPICATENKLVALQSKLIIINKLGDTIASYDKDTLEAIKTINFTSSSNRIRFMQGSKQYFAIVEEKDSTDDILYIYDENLVKIVENTYTNSRIMQIFLEDNYIYVGSGFFGQNSYTLKKYNLPDFNLLASTPTSYFLLNNKKLVTADENYLYTFDPGNDKVIFQYNKSNLQINKTY
ncbi:hypothetical protein, partial [Clostridium sporogenes]|uniref:hypothetical protein n=1 Tax=Clostridium sporogenes TaxID=1509 RepID=UPI0006BF5CF2